MISRTAWLLLTLLLEMSCSNGSHAWVMPWNDSNRGQVGTSLLPSFRDNLLSSSVCLARRRPRDDSLDFIERKHGNLVGDTPDLTEDLEMVRTIVKAADGRKADNIVALQVAQITTVTSYMVVLSGSSRPQNQAIAAAIMDDMEEIHGIHQNPQGTADSGWMVVDYGSIMVHIMTPKSRLYYNIEGQWRDKGGIETDMSDVLIPNKVEEFVKGGDTMEGLAEEDDPFWS